MQIGRSVSLNFLKSARFWIAVIAVALVIALRMTKFGELLSLDTLREHRGTLVTWVEANKLLASASYVLAYVAVVAFSFPGAAMLTLAGGVLFGAALGTALTVVGATIGATIVFLFARFLLGDRAFDRLGTQYPSLVEGIRENAWSYLLVLRFVPLFPFFLVNLVAAFVGVRLSTYVLTTLFWYFARHGGVFSVRRGPWKHPRSRGEYLGRHGSHPDNPFRSRWTRGTFPCRDPDPQKASWTKA